MQTWVWTGRVMKESFQRIIYFIINTGDGNGKVGLSVWTGIQVLWAGKCMLRMWEITVYWKQTMQKLY